MRTGFAEDGDESYLRIARFAESCGAGAITVHGRTREQRFKGEANLAAIRSVKQAVRIPVIGNGNVRTGADAKRMLEETGCDGVMVARGSLGNPWIYREISTVLAGEPVPPEPGVLERAAVLREHFGHLRELYGDETALLRVRAVIHWFVKGVWGSCRLRDIGGRVHSPAAFEEFCRAFEAADREAIVRAPEPRDLDASGGAPPR
jgi:tRNA-dihydrouridine synthase B